MSLILTACATALSGTALAEESPKPLADAPPQSAKDVVNGLMKSNRFDEAISKAKEFSAAFNCPQYYHLVVGAVGLRKKDYRAAVKAYDAYLKIAYNEGVKAYRDKALVQLAAETSSAKVECAADEKQAKKSCQKLIQEGQYDKALETAKHIAVQYKCPLYVFSIEACIALKQKDYERAARAYDRYLLIKPNESVEAARNMSLAHLAVQSFKSLWQERNPKLEECEQRLAKSGHTGYIVAAAQDALKLDPNDQRILMYLAYCSVRMGSSSLYAEIYPKIDPAVREDKAMLRCFMLLRCGDHKAAVSALADVLKVRKSSMGYGMLACSLALGRQTREARDAIARGKSQFAEHSYYYDFAEGINLFNEKKYDASLKLLDTYYEHEPIGALALHKKAECLLMLGRENEAAALISSGLLGKVGTAANISTLGILYSSILCPRKALECFDKCIRMEPTNYLHYFRRASVESDIWLFEQSREDCKLSLKFNPAFYPAQDLLNRCTKELERERIPLEQGIGALSRAAENSGYAHRLRQKMAADATSNSKSK